MNTGFIKHSVVLNDTERKLQKEFSSRLQDCYLLIQKIGPEDIRKYTCRLNKRSSGIDIESNSNKPLLTSSKPKRSILREISIDLQRIDVSDFKQPSSSEVLIQDPPIQKENIPKYSQKRKSSRARKAVKKIIRDTTDGKPAKKIVKNRTNGKLVNKMVRNTIDGKRKRGHKSNVIRKNVIITKKLEQLPFGKCHDDCNQSRHPLFGFRNCKCHPPEESHGSFILNFDPKFSTPETPTDTVPTEKGYSPLPNAERILYGPRLELEKRFMENSAIRNFLIDDCNSAPLELVNESRFKHSVENISKVSSKPKS